MFSPTPAITLHDPLAELLGAGDGRFTYTFDDVVKLSGHACPTVAGAFLLVARALELLWEGELPQRGGVAITVQGGVEEGVNGPISQVFTLLTGAAAENGFRGLGGIHCRKGLLRFEPAHAPGPVRFGFRRLDNGKQVTLVYSPEAIPPAPTMSADLEAVLSGAGTTLERERFTAAWRERVVKIVADGGEHTVRQL